MTQSINKTGPKLDVEALLEIGDVRRSNEFNWWLLEITEESPLKTRLNDKEVANLIGLSLPILYDIKHGRAPCPPSVFANLKALAACPDRRDFVRPHRPEAYVRIELDETQVRMLRKSKLNPHVLFQALIDLAMEPGAYNKLFFGERPESAIVDFIKDRLSDTTA